MSEGDRHLMFGLIALQNGLIDQDALLRAFRAWSLDCNRSLADHLIAIGAISPEGRGAVEVLLGHLLKRTDGSTERSLAQIPVAPSLAESLADIADTELTACLTQVSRQASQNASEATGPSVPPVPNAEGARFRVLRPHARGGLGAVFVALDAELNREVALKQILDGHADDGFSRSRFLLEAEVTGGLEHPGIVPVYGLGSYKDGRPYYAMRFIRGDTLREAIERFHAETKSPKSRGQRTLERQKLLRRLLDVCNTIQYAHSRGVLHRDIKPANVILGKHGETLVVDWGLAKLIDRSDPTADPNERTLVLSADTSTVDTVPGSALGTPAYMSPEQARGDLATIGPESDVYSLGATLYCLLTGKPPFGGPVADVLRNVQKGEFPPPRSVDASIDPALEAVCLKAMAQKPADRYRSPRELSFDIERWLADVPVSAYREPLRRRLARWERRHKSLVNGAISILAVTTIGLAIISSTVSREKLATEEALKQAESSALLAQSNLRLTTDSISRFFSEFQDQKLTTLPGAEGFRLELADQGANIFRGILSRSPKDREVLDRAQRVYRNAGLIHSFMGDFDGARKLYEQAIECSENLIKLEGEIPNYQMHLGENLRGMGDLLLGYGHSEEARTFFEKLKPINAALLAELGRAPANDRSTYQRYLGWTWSKLGEFEQSEGDGDKAAQAYDHALTMLGPISKLKGEWYWYRLFIAQSHRGLGLLAAKKGEDSIADQEFAETYRIVRALDLERPNDYANVDYVLAYTLLLDAERLAAGRTPERREKAKAAFDEAITLFRESSKQFPRTMWFSRDFAEGLIARGQFHASLKEMEAAQSDLTEAKKILEGLSKDQPKNMKIAALLGRLELEQGRLLAVQSREAEAQPHFAQAIARLEAAQGFAPRNVSIREFLEQAQAAIKKPAPEKAKPNS